MSIAKRDYDEYQNYLHQIKGLIIENSFTNSDDQKLLTKNNKEFVVKCLFVWKQEYTYRYKLTATIAKYLKDNKNRIKEFYIPDMLKYYYGIYTEELPNGQTKKCNSYFTKEYEKLIQCSYPLTEQIYKDKIIIVRVFAEKVFSDFCKIFNSTDLLGSWDDNDFSDAANFLINDFNIKKFLDFPDLGKKDGGQLSTYLYIRKLFENSMYIDKDLIRYYKDNKSTK